MSLINSDVDWIIVSFVFDKLHKYSHQKLKNIIFAFGRSKQEFLKVCIKYFYDCEFKYHKVNSIDDLLKKLLFKKTISNFPCYKQLKTQNKELLSYTNLKGKHRLIVYKLSLYYGYLPIVTNTDKYDSFGYAYFNFHNNHSGQVIKYSTLKKYRIHDLDCYDLIKKEKTLSDSTFKLKPDVHIYKNGVTKERKDIQCIRIIN